MPNVLIRHFKPSVKAAKSGISWLIISMPLSSSFWANKWNEWRISSKFLKKSRWSSSTFKIMPLVGNKDRKLFVYSHAYVRKISELPTRILPPMDSSMPPIEIVGSVSAFNSISEIIDVVVVFPCVPDTAIAF